MTDIHPESARVLNERWYVVENDLIGGWAIANADKPSSEIESKVGGEREIADCWSKEVAESIVQAHNAALDNPAVAEANQFGLFRLNAIERYAYPDEPPIFAINYPEGHEKR